MPIHPTAIVDPTARLHESVEVGPNAVIGREVEIGEGCRIYAGAVVCNYTSMGKNNRVHYYAVLGDDPQYTGFDPKTRSYLRIGDNNEFREHCTVHRGIKEGSETIIGSNNMLMAASHVAHDCVLGNYIVMANYAGLAGHVTVEDRVFLSGYAAVHQFTRIGKLAMIGGLTGISKDVPPFMIVRGDFGFLVGINVIGLRRAGVTGEARLALRNEFKNIFKSGRSLPNALADVRERWQGRQMPAELDYLLSFCETKSKRGYLTGRSYDHDIRKSADESEEE